MMKKLINFKPIRQTKTGENKSSGIVGKNAKIKKIVL